MKINAIILLVLVIPMEISAQNVTLSGFIKDSGTKESLIGANIYAPAFKKGASTNEYGFYSITLPKADSVTLEYSYVGYQLLIKRFAAGKNLRADVFLDLETSNLGEVIVNGKAADDNIQRAEMSTISIPLKTINSLPVLAGERDILKSVQFLPGVQQGQEGTTGYYVRGGNIDQNLVQLDEATIYNPNHLFGLFSTFNTNAIKSMSLITGGFPAKYGGRLSSILDITMKDGNKENFQVDGGIGLLSANLTLQGPIEKEKSSFIISGRRSYIDLLMKPFSANGIKGTNYYFYDFNAKLNYELGKNDHLFLSYFTGKDNALYTGANSLNFNIDFGNTTNTIRWNHIYGSRLFSNTSFIMNDYHLGLASSQGNYYSLLYTGIKDMAVKTDFTFIPAPYHEVKAGFDYIYHTLYPGALSARKPKSGNPLDINLDSIAKKYSNEISLYISDEIKINDILSVNYGLRFPVFMVKNKTYSFTEPRITAKISLSKMTSMKVSYTVMNQFVHLVPSSTASFPTDIWLTSNANIKPQSSKQFALGIFRNFSNNNLETSIELYYKTMDNQVLFKEGTQITLQTNLDNVLTFGSGLSYGAEFFLRKNNGRLRGWLSYTLSKTTQKFPDLNYGKPFPFAYDRRHNLSVAVIYDLSKHWTFSADFTFYSGMAFTLPAGRIFVPNDGSLYDGIYYDYTGRNNARLRAYNRLDISFSNTKQVKLFGRSYEREWVFGVYNLYNRQNPYFVYLTTDPVTKLPQAKQVSLLPVIPSISFNFKF